jgi:hypothetical protein
MKENADHETRVAGIPCGVVVDCFHHQPPFRGSPHLCDSDADYYGYTDLEWHLVDRRGYPASWLERKMTAQDGERIKDELLNLREQC